MVKTRRSLNGDVDDGDYRQNDITSVTVEKRVPGWTQRELRSNRYRVTRKLPHWPAKLVSKRLRTIKMPRIVFPESDTEPEKYSRRRRPVKVYFAGETDAGISRRRGRRTRPPPNYMEDSGDKPIQHNVRRSGRQRKLLHHNFNESWITNELKVKGYPRLYGQLSHMCTSSSESSSEDEQTRRPKRMTRTSNGQNHTDEDVTTNNRNKRTSARSGVNKKQDASESDMDNHNHEPTTAESSTGLADGDDTKMESGEENSKSNSKIKDGTVEDNVTLDSESNQGRGMRLRRTRQIRELNSHDKKNANHIQRETASDTDGSSDSGSAASEIMMGTRRQSNRTRKPNASFVELGKRQRTQARQAKSYTIRKKPYSLRERKPPKIIVRSQSPSSSSSSSSSDTEEDLNVSVKNKTKGRQKSKSIGDVTERALRDIQPLEVDGSVRFSSVGGLEDHIRCLREMVLFPLMYPQLFQKFATRPAKGVLFHGPPGTGKTLLARALSNECSIQGGQKVSFFMRKGADCLKKWVGESERHIKLLFQQASKMKPSIIFFDEIDALAPVRSVRQEQVHTSVVGTLLAEMDGLCDRGEVVVIGATNRLDAVDPALRRAGRFDRELYFPPPHASARRDILHIYTKHWEPPPSKQTLNNVAEITSGYGGSDLKALCSESVLKALRRVYPQVYLSEHALLIDTHKVAVTETDMVNAMRGVVAAGSRTAPPPACPLPPALSPLLAAQVQAAVNTLHHIYPLANKEVALDPDRHLCPSFLTPPAMLISGECAGSHIAPALLAAIEHCTVKEISVASLHGFLGLSLEQAIMTMFAEVRRVERGCVVYAPSVDAVWSMLGAAGAKLLAQLWASTGSSCLLLATSEAPHHQLPEQLQSLFPSYNDCIYNVRDPTEVEVLNFLKPVILNDTVEPPYTRNSESLPELPRAPPPAPLRPSPAELARRKRVEDYKLRELRIFLRDVCRKLAANRRFYKFTKPVDLEEVTDYLTIISQPMDLETMMTKVDMHRYNCAKEFLSDIDLICANALEYNPDRTSSDKQIRHEACSLRDHAHALIDVEMDSDFEAECQEITRRRAQEGTLNETDLPSFIYTSSSLVLPDTNASADDAEQKATSHNSGSDNIGLSNHTPAARRKRRRLTAWSKGLAKKPKTSHKPTSLFKQDVQQPGTDEESKENKPIGAGLNGDGSDHRSEQDEPDVRRVNASDKTEIIFQLHKTDGVKSCVLECTRSSEKSSATLLNKSQSPRKRNNSGHDSSTSDGDKIIINKTELAVIHKNTKQLRMIGLKALISLHSQLEHVTQKYRQIYDRSKLPSEISAIISKYMHHFDHK